MHEHGMQGCIWAVDKLEADELGSRWIYDNGYWTGDLRYEHLHVEETIKWPVKDNVA